ncbi:MAG: hypothetical protein ACMXYL_02305 [Candidatus Woesearchaeota archaeon]
MNTNITIQKDSRITIESLLRILSDNDELSKFILEPSKTSKHWITDQDLYSAFMVLPRDDDMLRRIGKVIESIMIIPAHAIGQDRKPLSIEEYERLASMVI